MTNDPSMPSNEQPAEQAPSLQSAQSILTPPPAPGMTPLPAPVVTPSPAPGITPPVQPVQESNSNKQTLIIALIVIGVVLVLLAALITFVVISFQGDHTTPNSSSSTSITQDQQNREDDTSLNDATRENDANSTKDSTSTLDSSETSTDADDDELKDTRNTAVSYQIQDATFTRDGTENVSAYNLTIDLDIDVTYPQLSGNLEHLDAINQAIYDCAMTIPESYYLNPDEETIASFIENFGGQTDDFSGVSPTSDALLMDEVEYYITYNNEKCLSIAFTDHYAAGSNYLEFSVLRGLTINLETGEVYSLDSVLDVNNDLANRWITTYLARGERATFAVGLWGREEFIRSIQGQGEGDHNDRLLKTFFIDENGQPHFAVSFAVSNAEGSIARGWWETDLTHDLIESTKKDSTLWGIIN